MHQTLQEACGRAAERSLSTSPGLPASRPCQLSVASLPLAFWLPACRGASSRVGLSCQPQRAAIRTFPMLQAGTALQDAGSKDGKGMSFWMEVGWEGRAHCFPPSQGTKGRPPGAASSPRVLAKRGSAGAEGRCAPGEQGQCELGHSRDSCCQSESQCQRNLCSKKPSRYQLLPSPLRARAWPFARAQPVPCSK